MKDLRICPNGLKDASWGAIPCSTSDNSSIKAVQALAPEIGSQLGTVAAMAAISEFADDDSTINALSNANGAVLGSGADAVSTKPTASFSASLGSPAPGESATVAVGCAE